MTLLLQVLPYALESSFLALKGGTAINLFYQNMPRLSVDIDLAYLQPDERNAALENIHQHLQQCKHAIEKDMGRTAYVQPVTKEGLWRKLNVHSSGAVVKIEPNDALRGVVEPAQTMDLCEAAQQEFARFTSVRVLSTADLYGGKLCAALDRQHPRDLFDVGHLLENEGIDIRVLKGFVVYLACHNRPMDELLNPNRKELTSTFKQEFQGMARKSVTQQYLEGVREQVLQAIHTTLPSRYKAFVWSVQCLDPDWTLLDMPAHTPFPAVDWKVYNLRQLQAQNPQKYALSCEKLRIVLGI